MPIRCQFLILVADFCEKTYPTRADPLAILCKNRAGGVSEGPPAVISLLKQQWVGQGGARYSTVKTVKRPRMGPRDPPPASCFYRGPLKGGGGSKVSVT